MTKRVRVLSAPAGNSTPAERITWLLQTVWDGNRSEMARAVGVTQSVLTKIALGQQGPGRRLLGAVAAHPKVNPGWLLSGEGEPLLAGRLSGNGQDGWPIPISHCLLPGPLDEHRNLLTDQFFPVAGASYKPSRYWCELRANDPIVNAKFSRYLWGDLLLMETDLSAWAIEELLDNRLCAILAPSSRVPKLGKVSWLRETDQEPAQLRVDTFQRALSDADRVEEIVIRKHPDGRLETKMQLLLEVKDDKALKKKVSVRNMSVAPPTQPIVLGDVIAVSTLMVRRYPG